MAFIEPLNGPADDDIGRILRTSFFVPVTVTTWETGVLIHASDAAAALFGATTGQLIGRPIDEFFVDPEQRQLLLRDIDAGAGSAQAEVQLRRADGRQVWVQVAAHRVTYRGAPCVLAISHDITE